MLTDELLGWLAMVAVVATVVAVVHAASVEWPSWRFVVAWFLGW